MSGSIPEKITIVSAGTRIIYYKDFDEGDYKRLEVIPAYVVDSTNSNTLKTALTWANNCCIDKRDIKQIQKENRDFNNIQIVNLERRFKNTKVWKVIIDGYYFDLRDDVLLDALQHSGANNNILNDNFIWAMIGSQMKIIRVGSWLHKYAIYYQANKKKKPLKDLDIGGIYLNKKLQKFLILDYNGRSYLRFLLNTGSLEETLQSTYYYDMYKFSLDPTGAIEKVGQIELPVNITQIIKNKIDTFIKEYPYMANHRIYNF